MAPKIVSIGSHTLSMQWLVKMSIMLFCHAGTMCGVMSVEYVGAVCLTAIYS